MDGVEGYNYSSKTSKSSSGPSLMVHFDRVAKKDVSMQYRLSIGLLCLVSFVGCVDSFYSQIQFFIRMSSPPSTPQQTPKTGCLIHTKLLTFEAEREKTMEIDKVVILFKETGSAPALKQKKFKLQANATFQNVSDFLRKQLGFKKEDPLYLFVNSSFQPCPDESVGDMYKSFRIDGKLIVNYCTTQAWG